MPQTPNREMVSLRLDKQTRKALEKKATQLGTSQSNALGVALGVHPESAYAKSDKANNLIKR